MKQKILFIDRDGTILIEPKANHQIDSLDKFAFVPGVISNLAKIVKELDYELVMVSNQDGLGTQSYPEETFWPAQNLMINILKSEGIVFSEILIDRSFEADKLPTRKPRTGLVKQYLNGNYDLNQSYVIGDRLTDVALAKNMGIKALLIGDEPNEFASLTTNNWSEIYQFLTNCDRKSIVDRDTSETKIHIDLNLDGTGETTINTGLGFFDHMLEQLGKHGGFNLAVDVVGDLHIDEHHTIEDTALALGEAINQALGSRKGISRYGFLLPMDDCLAQVALDFGGRPWLVWNATFNREKIGEMPTEMFQHFFKSFCDTARCNLNISAEGENEHHKIEAIFKGWAKVLKQSVARTNDGSIPSTKGVL